MTYGIGGTCAPGVLMGTAAGGVAPPTAITLYMDGTLHPRTQTRAGIDGTQDPNWGITQGVPDATTGLGTYGIALNAGADTGGNVPPNAQYSTFQVSMTNVGGGTNMEIDALDYWTNWVALGATGGYPDMINYGCYADGGTGTGVTWAWSVTIVAQSLSNGTVAFVSGTPILGIDGSFVTNGWTGV
ncbi:uncharacterized protein METZ01_LOCUS241254, partial [marine metagenome]